MADQPVIVTRVMADPVRQYLPAPYWNRARDWFTFNLDFNTLAAGAQAQNQSFNMQNDADFLCLALDGHATQAADGLAEQAEETFLIAIQDSGSGAQWFGGDDNGFGHIMNIFGALQRSVAGAVQAGLLEHPRFIPAASTVNVQLTNLDGANARRVFLAFRGVKIYRSLRQGQ